jgi:hypothetical protein
MPPRNNTQHTDSPVFFTGLAVRRLGAALRGLGGISLALCLARGTPLAIQSTVSLPPEGRLSARPSEINPGDASVLQWDVTNANSIVIAGLGGVSSNGRMTVHPETTATYTLIAENAAGVTASSATVVVGGARSTAVPIDESRFRYPLTTIVEADKIPPFVDYAFKVLQDQLKYSLPGVLQRGSESVLITSVALRPDLISPSERGIGARQSAMQVSIAQGQTPGTVLVTLRALVEYRRRVETNFRPEPNQQFYRDLLTDLRSRLEVYKR